MRGNSSEFLLHCIRDADNRPGSIHQRLSDSERSAEVLDGRRVAHNAYGGWQRTCGQRINAARGANHTNDQRDINDSNTAPLNAGVESLNNTLAGLAGGLQVAEGSFAAANDHMQETLDSVTAVAQ